MALRASEAGGRSSLLQLLARVTSAPLHQAHNAALQRCSSTACVAGEGAPVWSATASSSRTSCSSQQQHFRHGHGLGQPLLLPCPHLCDIQLRALSNAGGSGLLHGTSAASHTTVRYGSIFAKGRLGQRSGRSQRGRPEEESEDPEAELLVSLLSQRDKAGKKSYDRKGSQEGLVRKGLKGRRGTQKAEESQAEGDLVGRVERAGKVERAAFRTWLQGADEGLEQGEGVERVGERIASLAWDDARAEQRRQEAERALAHDVQEGLGLGEQRKQAGEGARLRGGGEGADQEGWAERITERTAWLPGGDGSTERRRQAKQAAVRAWSHEGQEEPASGERAQQAADGVWLHERQAVLEQGGEEAAELHTSDLPTVTAEVAAEVATRRRHSSMAHLPQGLQQVLEAHLEGSGLRPAQLRLLSQRLLTSLQEADAQRTPRPSKQSDTSAFGLTGPGSKRGAAAADRLAAAMEMDGIQSLDTASLHAALGLPPPAKESRDPHAAQLTAAYKARPQVAAYVAARAAPSYAGLTRVLRELSALSPPPLPGSEPTKSGFIPKTVLDYGAKAGLSLWALQEVWPDAARNVLAVEPSPVMSDLGVRVEAALKQSLLDQQQEDGQEVEEGWRHRGRKGKDAIQRPRGPMVNWVRELPLLRSAPQLKRKYDLVLCNYGLSEVPEGDKGRDQLVRQLWEMTSDTLVIIEPGTPAGFSHVREARTQVLNREARKRDKALASADIVAAGSPGAKLDVHAAAKLQATGAHVVAPCPHDRQCPMEGQRMWCHFGQRLERPPFVQRLLPGARGHQDELFSYVILRRGPRNTKVTEVSIARSAAPEAAMPSWALPEAVVKKQIMLNRMAAEAAAAGAAERTVAAAAAAGAAETETTAAAAAAAGSREQGQESGTPEAMSARDQLQDEIEAQLARMEEGLVDDEDGQGDEMEDGETAGSGTADDPTLRLLRSLEAADNQLQSVEAADQQLQPLEAADQKLWHSPAGDTPQHHPLHAPTAESSSAAAVESSQQHGSEGLALGGPIASTFGARFPAYGLGLLDRLMMMEEQGVAWAKDKSSQDGLTMDVAQLASSLALARGSPVKAAATHAAAVRTGSLGGQSSVELAPAAAAPVHVPQSPEQEREAAVAQLKRDVFGLDGDAGDSGSVKQAERAERQAFSALQQDEDESAAGQNQQQQQELLAMHASTRWGRLYRPPRVRGGHIMLDLCMPEREATEETSSAPEERPSKPAQLERHVVTRSDAKGWMGKAAWELAHEVKWGDLWPGWYSGNRRQQPVLDPDSAEAQARNQAAKQAKREQEQADEEAAMRHFGFDPPQRKRST